MVNIVVTGAAGFVGRVLIERLVAAGASVTAFDFAANTLGCRPGLRTVDGDLGDRAARDEALADGSDALVHLATVPGGAAEADPRASRRINIDAMYDLLVEARDRANGLLRVVYASSIAVLGDPLPPNGVNDSTPLVPRLIYGGHKAMMETAVAMMSARGEIDGVSLRLPAILARPKGPSAMKSAFMSDLFHAMREKQAFVCPVSPHATIWAESVDCCAQNLQHALHLDRAALLPTRALTLPALRIRMDELATEVARQTGADAALVRYRPDPALEQAFGAHPPLETTAANRAGFVSDGDLATLVSRALSRIAAER